MRKHGTDLFFTRRAAKYDKKDGAVRDAFNQYFSGGFNGRWRRLNRESSALWLTSAGAYIGTPALPGNPTLPGW
ncbi:MAG: hypothetical protein ACLUE2_02715 [Bacteroides cellulosilyticus]